MSRDAPTRQSLLGAGAVAVGVVVMGLPFVLYELDAPLGLLPFVFGTGLVIAAVGILLVLADLVGTGERRFRQGHSGQQRPEQRRE